MPTPGTAEADTWLDRMRLQADPLADDTISRIVGSWQAGLDSASLASSLTANAVPMARIAVANRLFSQWQDNQSLRDWKADGKVTPSDIATELEHYVHTACLLPPWAEPAKIRCAEKVFCEHGVLSCVLLFCSSLPECYVLPDLSSVLDVTGQLETHTDYRIRATAAMIFPVMMAGGLLEPQGSGIAQVIKVRLIHATIRNLILRGNPAQAVTASTASRGGAHAGMVSPLDGQHAPANMQQTLLAMGWDVNAKGLPCNQEELAYTLLTFSYVFLRSLRRLGIGLPAQEEEAYLHAWNVVGHVLGIQAELRVTSMDAAARLFEALQVRGRRRPLAPDPRPRLAQALMDTMAQVLPTCVLKPFPVLLTRYLCGPATSHDLGLTQQVSWLSRALFAIGMFLVRSIDTLIRLVSPRFCLSRFFTRLLGEKFIDSILLDQVRKLKLPESLRDRIRSTMQDWHRPRR